MRIEANGRGADEPEDGWVSAAPLVDTELLTTVLCRFTGRPLRLEQSCLARGTFHPDVDCHTLFVQADALRDGTIITDEFPEAQSEIRAPFRLGEAVAVGLPEVVLDADAE